MHIFSDTLLLLIILERRKTNRAKRKKKDIQQTHLLTEWKYIEKKEAKNLTQCVCKTKWKSKYLKKSDRK